MGCLSIRLLTAVCAVLATSLTSVSASAQTIRSTRSLAVPPSIEAPPANTRLAVHPNSASLALSVGASQVLSRQGENCLNPISVDSLPYASLDSTSNALDDFPPGPCFADFQVGQGPDVVYQFVLHSAQPESVSFYASPRSHWDLALYAMGPSCQPGFPCTAVANAAGPGLPEMFTFVAQPFQPYFVIVDGVGGDQGVFMFMCVLYKQTCRSIVAPPLVHTPPLTIHKPASGAGGNTFDLVNVVFSPCRDEYYNNLGSRQYSWARAKRFEDKGAVADAVDNIFYQGYYFVESKRAAIEIPCTCNYEMTGHHRLKTSHDLGVAYGLGAVTTERVQPFFALEFQLNKNRCRTDLDQIFDCSKDTTWQYTSPVEKRNVPTFEPQDIKLGFTTRAVALGSAEAWSDISDYRLVIECADPPEDRAQFSAADATSLARPPIVRFGDWKTTVERRRVLQQPAIAIPSGFSASVVAVDSTDRPGGLAGSAGYGFGQSVYLTRDIALPGATEGAPADTSRILRYQGGNLATFGGGVLYGPSALEFDSFGAFGRRMYAACADSFTSPGGTPIRDRGTLISVDSLGVMTTFARNLSSPVALAFAPIGSWNGNLYVAERESAAVDQVLPNGSVQGFATDVGTPMDLVFGTGGFGDLLYVVDADSVGIDTLAHADAGRILRFAAGGSRSELAAALQYPTAIVRADPAGSFGDYLYVTSYNQFDGSGLPIPETGRILKVDASGNVSLFADSLEQPMDLAFGPSGELFVAVSGGLVKIANAPNTGVDGVREPRLSLTASPNPFSARMTLRFTLPARVVLDMSVFDLAGRRVTTLARGSFEGGPHQIIWDGRDRLGREAPNGMYLVRLRTGNATITMHFLRVR